MHKWGARKYLVYEYHFPTPRATKLESVRLLIWIMTPLLIVGILLVSRFSDSLSEGDPDVVEYVAEGTALFHYANGASKV